MSKIKSYFYRKEYIYLYLTRFCFAFTESLTDIFGPVLLFKNGFSIAAIFLIYGLSFGVMGICSPLFLTISSRFGISACVILSNVFRVICSYLLIFDKANSPVLLIFMLALPGALSNPIGSALSTHYVDSSHRGKYNSMRGIFKIVGTVLGSLAIAYGVIADRSLLLFATVIVFCAFDSLFTSLAAYKIERPAENVLFKALKFILRKPGALVKVNSLKSFHICERLFLPLYLFLILQDFVLFSIIISLSLIIQILTMFIWGWYTDKHLAKLTTLMSIARVTLSSVFILLKDKVVVSFSKTAFDNLEQIYEMTFKTASENIMKRMHKEDPAFLSTVAEMSLCLTEVVIFSLFALVAYFIQIKAFIFVFLGSIIATIIVSKELKRSLR